MRAAIAMLSCLSLCVGLAWADERLDGLKKMNTEACVSFGSSLPGAPKDAKLIEPFCDCVSDNYWASVPQSEIDELLSAGHSVSLGRHVTERMGAAKASCKKKLGF